VTKILGHLMAITSVFKKEYISMKNTLQINFILKEEKIYMGTAESFGRQWQVGDVVGVFLDLMDHTISFSMNGELLMDTLGGETTFSEVQGEGFVPAFTLGLGQKAKLTFGQDVNSLKYFTTCGLQEGYEPFCVYVPNKISTRLPIIFTI